MEVKVTGFFEALDNIKQQKKVYAAQMSRDFPPFGMNLPDLLCVAETTSRGTLRMGSTTFPIFSLDEADIAYFRNKYLGKYKEELVKKEVADEKQERIDALKEKHRAEIKELEDEK